MRIAHLDYETRSGADLTVVGAHRYSVDPRFEILMASVSDEDSDEVSLWVNPKFSTPEMTSERNRHAEGILATADVIYAHNAPFEQAVTWGAHQLRRVSPMLDPFCLNKWRCTGAIARKAGLPWSLGQLAETLKLDVQKDAKGKKLIKFFCEPREDGEFNAPRDFPEEWEEFGVYCVTDNKVERAVYHKLKGFELQGAPLDTFLFDLRMNQRGIPINMTAARNAQTIINSVQSGVSERFRKETGLNPTQRDKVMTLIQSLGVKIDNMQADTLDEVKVNGRAGEIIGMYRKLSFAAVKKVRTMLDCACPDGKVRGGHLYYGAGTGRWSGKLLQPQNFKKTDPEFRPLTDAVYQAICTGTKAEALDAVYGEPLQLIANCIRNFIHAGPVEILDGDYSAIEARIICWLAGQTDVLESWRTGKDLYKWMAAHVYGITMEQVTPDQREVGKRIILGAGFQMGWRKFQSSCKIQYQLDLPKDLCKKGIKLFRSLCGKIRDYWWALNNSALQCIEMRQPAGPFTYRTMAGIPYLLFRLRSGRSLAYPYPEINLVKWVPEVDEDDVDEFGETIIPEVKWRKEITYWGQIPSSTQWGRIKLYGGKLAENETQATAADVMAYGAIKAEERGMAPFMLVHDQALALRDKGQTPEQFAQALAQLPDWANGLPIKVDAHISPWFKK